MNRRTFIVTAAGLLTAPLVADTTVIGSGSVDLWIASDAGDTDLEITISEVRPDGQEMYVQSGWLRVSHRALDDAGSSARAIASRSRLKAKGA